MFRHVIVGVDGQAAGRDAITLGLQLVDHDGRIGLAHVSRGEAAASAELLERERAEAHVDADLLSTRDHSVGAGLHRLAEEQGADLIVVGSCHRGRAGAVLLGDDTRDTLGGAPCAVGVAPAGYARSARPLGSVGVAYDMSAPSRIALTVARGLAVREDAGVRALRVVPYPVTPYMSEAPSLWEESSKAELKVARQALDLPVDVEGDVAMGRVQDELETFSGQVDVLVVGSRDRGSVRRAVLGSTAQHLARHAQCPLVIVTRGAQASPPVGAAAAESLPAPS